MKSLVERIERMAAIEGAAAGRPSCRTHRTDGFAAYPRGENAGQARVNAFEEAVERYVWSMWWDRPEIAFRVFDESEFGLAGDEFNSVDEMRRGAGVSKLHVLLPQIESETEKLVLILFGEIPSGGFISGGACGPVGQEHATFLRAMDELYRHGFSMRPKLNNRSAPELVNASVESSLIGIQTKLTRVILPVLSVIGIAWAAFSLLTGNERAKTHIWYAIIGSCIGFGAQSIVDFISQTVPEGSTTRGEGWRI